MNDLCVGLGDARAALQLNCSADNHPDDQDQPRDHPQHK